MSLSENNPKPGRRQVWRITTCSQTLEILAVLDDDGQVVVEDEDGEVFKVEISEFYQADSVCLECEGCTIERVIKYEDLMDETEAADLLYLFGDVTIEDITRDSPDEAQVWINGAWVDVTFESKITPNCFPVARCWNKPLEEEPAVDEVPVDENQNSTEWPPRMSSVLEDFGREAGIVVEEIDKTSLYLSIKATLRAARLTGLRPVYEDDDRINKEYTEFERMDIHLNNAHNSLKTLTKQFGSKVANFVESVASGMNMADETGCPNCSDLVNREDPFCRSCGLNLSEADWSAHED